MENPKILATWIMCPDGTMLPSFHRHDYREHLTIDKQELQHPDGAEEPEDVFSEEWREWRDKAEMVVLESRRSMVDGGPNFYSRRGGVYTEMSIYENDPYEVIRRFFCRGDKKKNGKDYLTWTPLFRINNRWLQSLIEYEESRNSKNKYLKYYKKEQRYRSKNNIIVDE